ncbi:MAG: family 78 glycoside hydrolase catalytic domain [Clostridia bacterium]|nr:family 78 glycoside hydrolase catalytic domain [Clostridia bacterium]
MEKVNKIEEYTYEQSPFAGSRWIAPTYSVDVAVITRKFTLNANLKGHLYICGLGYFEATVNGQRLTQDKLIPVATDYHTRDLSEATYTATDIRTHRMYYYEYDVEGFLKQGENVLEVTLGGGWYTQRERIAEGKMHYLDRPRLVFTLAFDDMSIYSDGTETWCESEIRSSNIFIGEVIDYRFRDNAPKPVIFLPHPEESIFSPSIGIPDRIIRKIRPRILSERNGKRIYDAGENVSALVALRANRGKFTLRYSEYLDGEGNLDFTTTGAHYKGTSGKPQIMTDVFISDGESRTFMPHFTWHAFRYFEIEGDSAGIEDVEVCVIHSDVGLTAEFDSDSEGANFLFDAYVRTQLSNYHGSYPSDCPHRERLGYTGDGQLCAPAAMMILDSKALYRKWIRDILDCQDINTGHVQHTAPFQGGGGGPCGWGGAIITVPYAFVKQFADRSILREALPAMRRYIKFTESCMENGTVVRESKGGWCLGDWKYLDSGKVPEHFVNTALFVRALRMYREMSGSNEFEYLEAVCLSALEREYVALKEIGAASVWATYVGIESPEIPRKYYEALGKFDTGFLATDALVEILFKHGYADTANKLLSSGATGSFLEMKRRGATSLFESWGCRGSGSHPMFGACTRSLFEGILGIRQSDGSYGYEKICFCPALPTGMNYARGSIITPRGKISVVLKRRDEKIEAILVVPDSVAVINEAGECYSVDIVQNL